MEDNYIYIDSLNGALPPKKLYCIWQGGVVWGLLWLSDLDKYTSTNIRSSGDHRVGGSL